MWVEFYSRNRNNVTPSYPDLATALADVGGRTDMIIDAEIVAPIRRPELRRSRGCSSACI